MGESLELNLNDMTLGEMDDFEQASGVSLSDIQGGSIPAKALIAMVWISKRRTNPKYTLKQARSVKVTDLSIVADPTSAKPDGTI